jgi:hypothetical protein
MTSLQTYINEENFKTQQWIDEDPKNRMGGLIPDADHWAEYGIYTVEQYEQYQMDVVYSDLYKEVYGMRPRHHTGHVTKEEFDSLLNSHARHMEEEKSREARAIEAFEKLITKTVELGAGDRETAIRWLMQEDEYYEHDPEYFEYTYQLPYGYLKNPELRA